MKLIRMLKMMAGPGGVRHVGKTLTVSDDEADQLVAAEAAAVIAVIAVIADPAQEADELPVEMETATVDPVAETAVRPKAKRKATL